MKTWKSQKKAPKNCIARPGPTHATPTNLKRLAFGTLHPTSLKTSASGRQHSTNLKRRLRKPSVSRNQLPSGRVLP